jgi:PAS domain S-box-containing protein
MPRQEATKDITWRRLGLVAGLMFLFTVAGLATTTDPSHPVWWPAAGLAYTVLRRGRGVRVAAVLLGGCLGAAFGALWLRADWTLALTESLADLAGAWAGAAMLYRVPGREASSLKQGLGVWGVAGLVALTGTLVALLPHLVAERGTFGTDFVLRCLARLSGVIVVAPLALAPAGGPWAQGARRDELLAQLGILGLVTVAAFSAPPGALQATLVFALFLPLVAAALRLPEPAPQAGVFLVAAAAAGATRAGLGLFAAQDLHPALPVFLILLAVTTQLVGAVTTEREVAYAAVAESEQRFRLMTENGRDLVCLHGLDGGYLWVSPSSVSILGWEPDDLLGRFLHTYVHHGDVLAVEQLLERVAAGRGTEVLRFRFRRKDGTWAWLEMTAQRTVGADGRPALQSATRDITERVRDLERLRLACQSAGIAVFSWDLLRKRMVDEGRFAELYGVDIASQPDPQQAMLDCMHPDDRAPAARALADALAGTAGYRTRFRVLHPTQGERHIFACGEVERDGAGRAVSMIGVNWDVTDQVRVEDELRQARDAAEKAASAKTAFLAMMSHEIRTPLNGIIGMTDALLPEVDRGNRNAVETIRRSGEMLLAVLNDILDFSKIEAGKLELEPQACDLTQVLTDLRSLYEHAAEEKGLRLVVELKPDLGRLVCDPLRLRQVLGNLVSNAVKFTSQGSVTVTGRRLPPEPMFPQGSVALDVIDTGIGIPADKVDLLFHEFSQLDAGTTRRYGGTGLGLAISRRLVEAMGGGISVASTARKGSTFTVVLPLPTQAQLDSAGVASPAQEVLVLDASSLKGSRALLAEDNSINRRVAVALMSKMGMEVLPVENGREAVAAWRRGGWDVVVMDMQMPELDGLGAARAIRDEEEARGLEATPILAMTANAFAEDRQACLEAGMNEVVTKPTTRAALQSALVRLLARARRASQRASAPASRG